jgi:hypothetical protein
MLPGGDWHFCHAPGPDGEFVRTIEWRDREVARGRRPFDYRVTGYEDVE